MLKLLELNANGFSSMSFLTQNDGQAHAILSNSPKTAILYELKKGQDRLFHKLSSGLKMEVIEQRKDGRRRRRRREKESPPLVFVHGSYHAAWCWAEHWLPFFSSSGYDSYAISLLGQGESDEPLGTVAGTLEVTLSLAAKRFQTSIPLCRETFFSSAMNDQLVHRYQSLMKESSRKPLFDLKKLNASLPVPKPMENLTKILVLGAKDDFIVDNEGLEETGRFYDIEPVCIEGVAHDMMLDCSSDKGAEVLLHWGCDLSKPGNLYA